MEIVLQQISRKKRTNKLLLSITPSEKLIVVHGVNDFSHFLERGGSLSYSEEAAAGLITEPDKPGLNLHTFFKDIFNIILISTAWSLKKLLSLRQEYSLPAKCNWSQQCCKNGDLPNCCSSGPC
jgi:hypothetical protein